MQPSFAAVSVTVQPAAARGSLVEVDGTVENGARVAAGEIVIRGTVHGDANLIADRLDLAPGARITGDLDYRTRTPLSPEAAAQVEGTVRYQEPPIDDPGESGTAWGVLLWFWQTLAALLTGILAVALSDASCSAWSRPSPRRPRSARCSGSRLSCWSRWRP